MDLKKYSAKDFVLNESFQKWILDPDVDARVFWEDWLNAHPDKTDVIAEAKSMIQSIKESLEKELSVECDQVWNMITESIQDLEMDALLKKIREIENTR